MEIVIKIDDERYNDIQRIAEVQFESNYFKTAEQIIANGTPLPKGHGRLIDSEIVWNKLKELEEHYQAEFLKKSNVIHEIAMSGRLYGFTNSKFVVQDAPTIIEADT